MNIVKTPLLMALLAGMLLGAVAVFFWQKQSYPGQPLFVEIVNLRQDTLPLLTIEHGNDFVQEKILLTQIQAGEKRVVSLNHEPGRGYSLKANLDGQELDVCVGKASTKWVNRVVLTPNGIFSKD